MKTQKKLGNGLVLAGMLFFFNPYIAAMDFLPDFIGCLLIWLGLLRTGLINTTLAEAGRGFLKVALADVAKNICLLVVFGAGSPAEQPTALLLIAFGAAVVELLLLIPAVSALFEGWLSLANIYDAPTLYTEYRSNRTRTDVIKRATIAFLLFREIVCLLPEFTALTLSSYFDSGIDNLYDYIGVLRLLSFTVVAIGGFIWAVRLCTFFHVLRKEKAFLGRVSDQYAAYHATHPGVSVERRHALSFVLMFAGALLLCDFYLDFKNVIPDFLGGLLLLAGALIPAVPRATRIRAAAFAGVYTVLSLISSHRSYQFAMNFSAGQIEKNPEAASAYLSMWGAALAEFLSFLVFLVLLLLLLREVVRKWAGYRAEQSDSDFEQKALLELFSEFDGQLIRCFVVGFVSSLCSFLYDYMQLIPRGKFFRILEFFWFFDFCASLVFALVLGTLLSRIQQEIKNRFRYD